MKFDPSGKHCIAEADAKTPSNRLFISMAPTKESDMPGLRYAYARIHEEFKVKTEGCVKFEQIPGTIVPVCIVTYDTKERAIQIKSDHHMKPPSDDRGGVFIVHFFSIPPTVPWTPEDSVALQKRLEKRQKRKEKKDEPL